MCGRQSLRSRAAKTPIHALAKRNEATQQARLIARSTETPARRSYAERFPARANRQSCPSPQSRREVRHVTCFNGTRLMHDLLWQAGKRGRTGRRAADMDARLTREATSARCSGLQQAAGGPVSFPLCGSIVKGYCYESRAWMGGGSVLRSRRHFADFDRQRCTSGAWRARLRVLGLLWLRLLGL